MTITKVKLRVILFFYLYNDATLAHTLVDRDNSTDEALEEHR